MKKLLITLCMLLGVASFSYADEYAHNDKVLPAAARTILKKNFKSGVSLVKIDKDFGRVSDYEVVMTDGSEIKFDSKGNWKEVETSDTRSVPSGFVLPSISKYVASNHKGARIVGIEKKRDSYEVELSNGVDIEFGADGTFKRYD